MKVKDYYDLPYAKDLAGKIKAVYPTFDVKCFLGKLSNTLENLEFSDRQTLLAHALKDCMPEDYTGTIDIFTRILGEELEGSLGMFTEGYWLWPIGKYVELFGADYFETSTAFSYELTKRFTGEFCMRPIIAKHPEKSMHLLLSWSTDKNKRVRRLSSECLRIRLPWAKKLYVAMDYFDVYELILSNLRNDPDKTIQKSVANNLNDLYKEYPDKMEVILRRWQKEEPSRECTWIIHHASRTKRKKEEQKCR